MNRIYRLIWNHTLGALVPVAEITRSKRGGPVRRVGAVGHRRAPLATALALALGLAPGVTLARAPLALASLSPSDLTLAARSAVVGSQGIVQPPSHPLPTGGQVVGGSATIGQHDTTLTVDQSSQSSIIDWQSFDIGAGYTVTFHQPNASSVALNRVLGTDPSAIYGHLNANGQVFLVNPYGVYFAPGAQVDVGGLVASTLDISNPDFLAGRYRFSGSSTAGVRNDGRITAANGGYVAFIGPQVNNTGSITTPGGTTALGAGSRVNLTLAGHGLVSFQVDGKALNALAQNGGLIAADGGRVILTAQAKDALLRTVVNNTGRIQAQTVANHDGTITLLGGDSGTVQVAGTLDASAPNGGDGGAIDTSGAHVKIADSAVITTHAAAGADGHWLIDPQDFTIAASGGDISGTALSTALGSGNVTIQSTTGGTAGNGDIFVNDTVSWSSNTLTLSAYRDIVVNATMNGSGTAGLALQYGQGSTNGVINSTTAGYTVNAPINLTSAGSFSIQLGTAGSTVNYTIIDSLGATGSTTGTDLQGIGGNLAGNYVLGADIDASATASWNAGHGFSPIGGYGIGSFTGTFDGLGHTVSGLAISEGSNTNAGGLFGINAGTLRNVGLIGGNLYYATPSGLGALAGVNTGTISHAYATTTVRGSDAGGLVGSNRGTIVDSYASGTVTGYNVHVGGLVGYNASSGSISHAHATGSVNGTAIGAGGLVGKNDGTVSDAYATGSVSGTYGVGGLVGTNYGAITEVYATGDVQGTHGVGGLVGSNYGAITEVYATGDSQGTNAVGGLVGDNKASIQNAYATGNASGGTNVGGLVGLNSASSTVTNGYWDTTTGLGAGFGSNSGTLTGGGGLTTAELAAALPTGFDASVWANGADSSGNGQTTPYLLANASFDSVGGHVILGSDTSATPTYFNVIQTLDQLQNINSTGLAGDYVLGNDIDASATAGWNGGAGFDPIGSSSNAFTGMFDGLNHIVSELTIDRPTTFGVGLFGAVSGNVTLRNVGLVGGNVTGQDQVGGLIGFVNGGTATISHSYTTGDVSGKYSVGGLVGYGTNAVISDSHATGTIKATSSVAGGLVGTMFGGSVSESYATGNVSGGSGAGGLVGTNSFGTITDSYSTGDVNGTYDTGGLVGYSYGGSINNAYATGKVSGTADVGGLLGYELSSTISNAYATGDVIGNTNVGGLVGSNGSNSTITDTYATGHVSGSSLVGGLVGLNSNLAVITNGYWDTTTGLSTGIGSNQGTVTGGGGLTTLQLAAALPTGFDSSVWANAADSAGAGQTTPYLLANASFDTVGGHVVLASDSSATPTYYDVIQTLDQLQAINSTGLAGDYVLGNDIDASATASWNGGAGFDPIGNSSSSAFTGVFDGLGYTINGLTIDRPTSYNVGLFGYVSDNGELRNIGMVGGSVTGNGAVGTLVGIASSITGTVTISNASASADVSGNLLVGGLAGKTDHTIIDNAYATGDVSGTNSVGGLVGMSTSSSSISNAYATGNIVGGDYAGGLIGIGTIVSVTNTYATGDVTGADFVGGLIGSFDRGTVTGVYATGSVSGSSDVGGLIGLNKASSTVTDGYWDTTTGLSAGFGSNTGTVTGGGGLTTTQLAAALPTGFSSSTWANGADSTGAGQTTPYLLANASFDTVGGHVVLASDSSATPTYYDVIQTLGQLQNINTTGLAGDYVLGNDIDASATVSWNGGAGFDPIGNGSTNFSGIFDGLGHTISNLSINRSSTVYVGLFGANAGTVRGVGVVGGTITGHAAVGALAGLNTGIVDNVYSSSSVAGYGGEIGGLIGSNSNGTISNAWASGDVTGPSGTADLGGLVGFSFLGTISNAYATGAVSNGQNAGGLAGVSRSDTISNVYATGPVSGASQAGGLVGSSAFSIITNGYWDTTTGLSVGISSNVGSTVTGGGLTTTQLAAVLPTGFDSSVWANGDNQTTPYLLANGGFSSIGGHVIVGSDTSATPTYYDVIQTLDQLQNITTTGLSGDYVLGNDIDASATAGWNSGAGFDPIGSSTNAFTGIFDGLDHTISGLNINRSGANDIGLFGYSTGTLRHVGLSGGTIVGGTNVGALAGENHGIVDYAHASSTVGGHGSNVGGLIGFSSNGTITNVYATGPVTSYGGTSNIGGLVGFTRHDTISDAYATGDVSDGSSGVGGLAGAANSTSFHNVYATGNISGSTDLGGLVGSNNYGDFYNVYATGDVDGSRRLGGLIGENDGGTIGNAYASGNVSSTGTASGSNGVGGLIGSNSNAIVSDVYATGNVSGTNEVGGLIGLNYHSTVSNAYGTGNVSGTNQVGGLIGLNHHSTVSSAYATGRVSGTGSSTVGGLVGVNDSNSSVTNGYWDTTTGLAVGIGSNTGGSTVTGSAGLTTTQLAAALPTGFDASVWANGADATGTGQTTPYLLANASFDTVGGHVILGSDSSATPTYYDVIQTLDQLQNINTTGLSGDYVLGNDIDASTTAGWNGGAGFVPIGSNATSIFTGVFDGLDHTVTDLTINRTSTRLVGLFGSVQGGTLRNIALAGGNISGNAYVGALVGVIRDGTISNAHASTTVDGTTNVGGLVGLNSGGTISDAYASGSVSGTDSVGGLVGMNSSNGAITRTYATSTVSGTHYYVGGLVGNNNGTNTSITDSYASGSVIGGQWAGGLVGVNNAASVTGSYATGAVSGTSFLGGLIGDNLNGAVASNVYATGNVSGGSNVGGLVGLNTSAAISNAYATGNVSGSTNVGGLVAWNTANSTITDTYATGQIIGTTHAGGLVGLNDSASAITYGYWDTSTGLSVGIGSNGIGTNQGTVTGSGGLSTTQLAAALPTGFDSSVWANGADSSGNGQTTPYLLVNASLSTVGGHVILGSDTSATPTYYDVIQTLDQLQNINSTGLAGDYVLGNDIDASATASWDGGAGFSPIGSSTSNAFSGVFDGLGHTVSNLTIYRPSTDDVGLFGAIGSGGVLRDLGLLGGTVTGRLYVGALAGQAYSPTSAGSTTVSNVYATTDVSGITQIGGLIGNMRYADIDHAYATGNVTGSGDMAGGLVGEAFYGTISDVYANGDVSGFNYVGGLVGASFDATINNTFATGTVSGSNGLGALVGLFGSGTVTNGYWNSTTGLATGYGIESGTVTGGGGLTSTQMMQQASFTGFDFSSPTWVIYEGHTAPLLNAFLTDLTITATDQTQTYNGGTFGLSGATYSVTGADSSGHLFGLGDAYDGATDVGTYAADLWSDQHGYRITIVGGSLTIDPKTLTLSGLTIDDKVYDGTTDATFGSVGSLAGIVGIDDVTLSATASASFQNADAGTGKLVMVSGLGLSGADAGNYVLSVSTYNTLADITPKTLTLDGLGADNKVYDGTTDATLASLGSLAGIVGSDGITLSGTASANFQDANAGTGKLVMVSGLSLSGAAAGNYVLDTLSTTADITPRTLTLDGLGADDKVYDGTTDATLASLGVLNGVIGTDDVSVDGAAADAAFADANAGTGKIVTVSGLGLAGAAAGNYVLAGTDTTTADVTPRTLTVSLGGDPTKTYDGTTAATLDPSNFLLQGFVSGEGASIGQTRGNYASAKPGLDITVTATLGGSDYLADNGTLLSNYSLPGTAIGFGTILPGDTGSSASFDPGFAGAIASADWTAAWGYTGIDRFSALLDPRLGTSLRMPGKPTGVRLAIHNEAAPATSPSLHCEDDLLDPFRVVKSACRSH